MRGGQQRAAAGRARPPAAAGPSSRTRAFSVTTCRARRRSSGSAIRSTAPGLSVTSRREGTPSDAGGVLAGTPPGRVPPVGQSVPHPGVDDQQDEPGRREVERHVAGLPAAAVQQQGMTGPAEQGRGLVHDPASGRPTNSFSARRASAASPGRGTLSPCNSVSASAVAHSRAAEDDSAAPRSRSASMAMLAPRHGIAGLAQRPGGACRVRRPAGDRARGELGSAAPWPARPGTWRERSSSSPSSRRDAAALTPWPSANGSTKPSL